MPMMPRIDKKIRSIAYNILGVPANMNPSSKTKYKQPKEMGSSRYNELERAEPKSVFKNTRG